MIAVTTRLEPRDTLLGPFLILDITNIRLTARGFVVGWWALGADLLRGAMGLDRFGHWWSSLSMLVFGGAGHMLRALFG